MGYRSDGAIRIRGPYDLMLTQIAHLNVTGGDHMREAIKERFVLTKDDSFSDEPTLLMAMDFEGCKWYDDYPDVQAVEQIWRHFNELHDEAKDESDEQKLDGAFTRIGEEENDIDSRYFGADPYELTRVSRIIECSSYPAQFEDIRHNLVLL